MVSARVFLNLERMANERPKHHGPGQIVSLTIKQIFNTEEERRRQSAEEEGRIALRAKRLLLILNMIKQWNTLLSEFNSRPSRRTLANPDDFLRAPSRPSFFLRAKDTRARAERTVRRALP
jgi:hypothetical protein